MSLETELGIDLGDVDLKAAEENAAKGFVIVSEGLHHAVLDAVRNGQANTGTHFREFTFKIIAGPFKDSTVEHTLYMPSTGQKTEAFAKSKSQLAIYLHRLGVRKKVAGADGKESLVPIEGKHDFCDALGTEVAIDVKHELEQWKDKKTGADKSIMKAKLSFEGVLLVNDKRCEKMPKAGAAAVASAGKAAASKPKDDFTEL